MERMYSFFRGAFSGECEKRVLRGKSAVKVSGEGAARSAEFQINTNNYQFQMIRKSLSFPLEGGNTHLCIASHNDTFATYMEAGQGGGGR